MVFLELVDRPAEEKTAETKPEKKEKAETPSSDAPVEKKKKQKEATAAS